MSQKTDTVKQWVEQYTDDLYRRAYNKTNHRETSEDLVQEVFQAALINFDTFENRSNPKTWLFAILNHKIVDFYRKKVNQPVSIENEIFSKFFDDDGGWQPEKQPKEWRESEGHLLDDDDFQEILRKCLEALPEKWNTCIKLKYLTEKNGEEICQELDIAPTNLWQIIHRAKLQLRDCVEKNWFQN